MHSYIVVGLAFGDEGKGSWVDHLCRKHNINTVVRFNGGAQAKHYVTTESGTTHGFSQFGSHSFMSGAKTLLSRFMLIEPMELLQEVYELNRKGIAAPLRNLYISEQAPIIPFSNLMLNRIMETARGSKRHGSCGLGIGLTQRDIDEGGKPVIRAGDLKHRVSLVAKLRDHLALTIEEAKKWDAAYESSDYRHLQNAEEVLHKYVDVYSELGVRAHIIPEAAFLSVLRRQPVVFEGAQGALLDQNQGTFPHCTRSTTTPENARRLLFDANFSGDVTSYGLLRAYSTRHGAGPMPTESKLLTVPPCDNAMGPWQGAFRTGWFDAVAARSALLFSPVDQVVLTNLDRLDGQALLRVATRYEGMSEAFYDESTHQLKLVSSYEHSRKRTQALATVLPQYEHLAGFIDESDQGHETYIRFIESELGVPIRALSRRKDSKKIYRA